MTLVDEEYVNEVEGDEIKNEELLFGIIGPVPSSKC